MSMTNFPSHGAPRPSSSQVCATLLGQHIQAARLWDGRPLEEIAPLAGLTVPEWKGIEAGQAPDTWEHICLIAAVLHLGRSWMPYLSRLWIKARLPWPENS